MDQKTRRRAEKAKEKVYRMVKEIEDWKGERPTVVRVSMSDYLALVEANYVNSFANLEVKPG